jgi:hypothetical protein
MRHLTRDRTALRRHGANAAVRLGAAASARKTAARAPRTSDRYDTERYAE